MIVNTHRLFARLLSGLQIDTICDIGSMNGADALNFSLAAPAASIYAFEPNPINFRMMQSRTELSGSNIHMLPLAVGERDGTADFYMVEADYGAIDARRGMSSLYRRREPWAPARVEQVSVTRLDSFFAAKCLPASHLALWIDAEGKAYEVIEGLGERAMNLRLVHVEVESVPCIGAEQKLYPAVRALLRRLGLTEIATDRGRAGAQFNAVFARVEHTMGGYARLVAWLAVARLRYLIVRTVVRVWPACAQRYQAPRRRIRSQ